MRNFDYAKLAEWKWDGEILRYVAKIHEAKGRQELYLPRKPKELERLVKIAKIQSTKASNQIEGITTTSTRLKQLVEEKIIPRNRDEREILGYRDVLNTIHENHDYIPIAPSYILQLHRNLLKQADFSYGGNFKNTQNFINETHADGTQVTRFTPMAPYETPRAVEKICESYKQVLDLEVVDALILIPVFICDFLSIHPFNDGNGRISRLLTLLLLYQNGYEVGKYISIEKQIEKTKDIYYSSLEQSDIGWHEGQNDPTPFIKYMLHIILACYVEFEERVGLIDKSGVKSTAYDIVKTYMLGKIGKMTRAEVIAACPSLGSSSVYRVIKKLTEEGLILKCGKGKNAYYLRADSIQK